MKIKLLRDIPGYKAGYEINESVLVLNTSMTYAPDGKGFSYEVEKLVSDGFAELTDDIDMEEMRKDCSLPQYDVDSFGNTKLIHGQRMKEQEIRWFTAYRIVKTVIEKLNGDWEPDWDNQGQLKHDIYFEHDDNEFTIDSKVYMQVNILPYCKNYDTATKVISLCEHELRTLFNIK